MTHLAMLSSPVVSSVLTRCVKSLSRTVRFYGSASLIKNFKLSPATFRSHIPIAPSLIDPQTNHRPSYRTPNVGTNYDALIFGITLPVPPQIKEPIKQEIAINDPKKDSVTKIEAHKRDKYWRRRGMKHHRYLRWRKRNETMLEHRARRKAEKRDKRFAAELESIWREAGLTAAPPVIPEEKKKSLAMKWKEEGIWTEAYTPEELFGLTTKPDPSNKKILPPRKLDIPR